jgi:hypothetical protein
MTIEELRPNQDATVVLHLRDGEIATVRIVYVDAEYGDIMVDVIQSNREYKRPEGSAYTITASEVVSVNSLSD